VLQSDCSKQQHTKQARKAITEKTQTIFAKRGGFKMPRKPNTTGDHYNDVFPSRFRSLIERNGTRQEELVEVLGVKARQSVTGYADGSTTPTIDKITALARYFNVSADYLLGLSDVESLEPDINNAQAVTGLSAEAISDLTCGKYDKEDKNFISALITEFEPEDLLKKCMQYVEADEYDFYRLLPVGMAHELAVYSPSEYYEYLGFAANRALLKCLDHLKKGNKEQEATHGNDSEENE
jgi:transcriptional regulator with XRE-family HTH domain